MNPIRIPKEVLRECARRDMQGTKVDRVQHRAGLCSSNVLEFYLRDSLFR